MTTPTNGGIPRHAHIRADITDADALRRITPDTLRRYLQAYGWTHADTWRDRIEVWIQAQGIARSGKPLDELLDGVGDLQILVQLNPSGSYATRMHEAIELLARLDDVSQLDVYYELLALNDASPEADAGAYAPPAPIFVEAVDITPSDTEDNMPPNAGGFIVSFTAGGSTDGTVDVVLHNGETMAYPFIHNHMNWLSVKRVKATNFPPDARVIALLSVQATSLQTMAGEYAVSVADEPDNYHELPPLPGHYGSAKWRWISASPSESPDSDEDD